MTEAQWRECTDAADLLEWLGREASKRKLQLFACTACWRIWDSILDPFHQEAVQLAEQVCAGILPSSLLTAVCKHLSDETGLPVGEELLGVSIFTGGGGELAMAQGEAEFAALLAVNLHLAKNPHLLARNAAFHARVAAVCGCAGRVELPNKLTPDVERQWHLQGWAIRAAHDSEDRCHSDLLRDIFGNPFRPVTPDPAWQTSTVVSLAQAIYDERAFDRMPILADALEDAGCTSGDVLNHCREPAEHVRGCWVVDLVFGKQ